MGKGFMKMSEGIKGKDAKKKMAKGGPSKMSGGKTCSK